jgi:phage terminase small subunit
MTLTHKQNDYIRRRINGAGQAQAAVAAGYAAAGAAGIAHRMEKLPKIAEAIAAGRLASAEKQSQTNAESEFEDAESYLEAVVRGSTPPDMRRISAAKTLISYQRARERAPVKSKTPTQMQQRKERDFSSEWAAKAASTRARFGRT